jgi:RNA polymerase sigma-70 factor, ECF subfamily
VAQAQAGDAEGLNTLYVRYAPDVLRYVTSFVRDSHDAEDITQNVFAKLVTSIGKYEGREEVPFAAWIMRVARNAALDHMRAKRAIPTTEGEGTFAHIVEAANFDRGLALRQALEQLPDDQREVLILRHIAGLSPSEIAAAIEISESSVHGLQQRGRRALLMHERDLRELLAE